MNLADSERISAFLSQEKGVIKKSEKNVDLVVVVTCGVRQSAEERAISAIKKLKRENPGAFIILTGCLAHREDVLVRLEKIVSLSVKPAHWGEIQGKIANLISLSKKEIAKNNPILPENQAEIACFYKMEPFYENAYRAFIPIMTGCNNFCSYCVVPYARGREISRSPEEILKEAKSLIKKGIKEIYLLGQNVNSYQGEDADGKKWDFTRLIKKIDAVPGDFWIKFLSSHPKDVTEKLIKTIARLKKVSPNLHLPIQSGSNRILALMNRKYTREDYFALVKKIKALAPQTVLSSDLIVGFPGETEQDFLESLDVLKKCQFEMLFSLKYSRRPGTAAFKLKEDVKSELKKERQKILDGEWKKIADKINKKYLGKKVLVLIDRKKKKKSSQKGLYFLSGKNFEEKNVFFEGDGKLVGKLVYVRIKSTGPLGLRGKFLEVKK